MQESDDFCSVVGRCETAIRLHVVAGHDLIGACDEVLELFLVPDEACALHCAGIVVVRQRSGFPSDNLVQVRALSIVAFLDRVAGSTGIVENLFALTILRRSIVGCLKTCRTRRQAGAPR